MTTQIPIRTQEGKVTTLTANCIEDLHNLLSENALEFYDMEPISPTGVKNQDMLESAVFRQLTGIGNEYKYPNYSTNCATLVYGIVKDHAFHNGNKRAALLSLIKHLNVNSHVLSTTLSPNELYDLLISVAKNELKEHSIKFIPDYRSNDKETWTDDDNVEYISNWIRKNSMPQKIYIGEKIKFSSFKKILETYELQYRNEGKHIIIEKTKKKMLFGLIPYDDKIIKKHKYFVGQKKNHVKRKVINQFRKDFGLTKNFGVDNVSFYDEENVVNEEIKKYKTLIYRLSKT